MFTHYQTTGFGSFLHNSSSSTRTGGFAAQEDGIGEPLTQTGLQLLLCVVMTNMSFESHNWDIHVTNMGSNHCFWKQAILSSIGNLVGKRLFAAGKAKAKRGAIGSCTRQLSIHTYLGREVEDQKASKKQTLFSFQHSHTEMSRDAEKLMVCKRIAKQSQLPQPLPIRLVLQTLHQLRCPSLDTLQHLNVSLVVRGPKLNTVFEVRPHQCRVQGHDHFRSPAGHTIFDTSQDAIGFLGRLGTLLAHIQPAVNQHPQVLFHQAAFQPLFPKPVALHGVAVAQQCIRATMPHMRRKGERAVGITSVKNKVSIYDDEGYHSKKHPGEDLAQPHAQLGEWHRKRYFDHDCCHPEDEKALPTGPRSLRGLGNKPMLATAGGLLEQFPLVTTPSLHPQGGTPDLDPELQTCLTSAEQRGRIICLSWLATFLLVQPRCNTLSHIHCHPNVVAFSTLKWLRTDGAQANTKPSSTPYWSHPYRITESQNHTGWKRPLRSSSPTVNLTLPRPPLNHVPKHLIQPSFKYFQGRRLNHFPGQPVPRLDNPFSEVKFPNIQSKPPLAQLEAISSCPITCHLGEETDPHLSTTSFQAKQPQFPQPLLISLVLQTLHQLRCPSLDTLQPLNVSLVVRGPKLNTVFKVQPHQCQVQGADHFPSPAGHAIPDTSQDAIGFLGRLGTLLAHIQPAVNQHPQVLLCQAAFQPLFPKPVALHGVVVAQVQDLALSLFEPHRIDLGPSIQPFQLSMLSMTSYADLTQKDALLPRGFALWIETQTYKLWSQGMGYEALEVEGQSMEDGDDSLSTPEVSPRSEERTSRINTTSTRKRRQVIVVGDSLLRGTEGPICWTDSPLREACCLPGARVKDITRVLPSLVRPSDYYLLLLFHVGGYEGATRSPRAIKRDFRALGRLVRDSGAQIIFSSLLPFVGSDTRRNGGTQSINSWLRGWCHRHRFGFFDNGMAYTAPGLLASDGIHLSQRGKRIFAQELAGLIDRALN
ncbi:hypothetical protein QYF61_004173 [Mycteria americana]|uniref:SGNH hydrolase-type esterase domain-containing protein n=1 Tax=Mycteria americana TaxID=33587 RepID=A0AAN7PGY2_MYCAM|nr:hypothetical protein QYF61_004173 [Mycteria americana]